MNKARGPLTSPEIQKKSSKSVLLLLTLTAWPTVAFASAGTSGGTILNIPVGARAIAMGEAFTAQADDVSSLYWNPAGIAILNQSQASFMYNQFLQDQTYHNVAVATPLENGGVGGSLSYLSFGRIRGFDENDNATGDVSAYSTVATLGGGMLMGPLSLGANLKGVQAKLADVSANGYAADLGGIWTFQREVYGGTMRVGATLRNVGSGLKFIDQRDPFPRQWRLGVAAVQMLDRRLNASFDFGQEREIKPAMYTGFEYWVIPMVALRAGYAGTHQEGSGLRAGLGLRIHDFSFDYAYSGYGGLGMSHRYELSIRFGAIRPTLTPEERAMLRRARLAMAEGRYDEATLLLDSLITMEPRYRLFRRLVKVAMRGSEYQERMAESVQPFHLAAHTTSDPAMDEKELTELLQLSDDTEALAASRATDEAATSALAPYIPPSMDPEKLK
jgi:hypothetical protein